MNNTVCVVSQFTCTIIILYMLHGVHWLVFSDGGRAAVLFVIHFLLHASVFIFCCCAIKERVATRDYTNTGCPRRMRLRVDN